MSGTQHTHTTQAAQDTYKGLLGFCRLLAGEAANIPAATLELVPRLAALRSMGEPRTGPRLPPLKRRPQKPPQRAPQERPTAAEIIAAQPSAEVAADSIFDPSSRPDTGVKITFSTGASRTGGLQDHEEVRRRNWSLKKLSDWIQEESRVGDKDAGKSVYQGTPKLTRQYGAATKANVESVQLWALDFDGGLKAGDIEKIEGWLRDGGLEAIVHSSSSHDPAGVHPKEAKRGKRAARVFGRWSKPIAYEAHKAATKELLATMAAVLGIEGAADVSPRDLHTWLATRGLDPATSKAMQPVYVPRWATKAIAAQAFHIYMEGEALDPAPLLKAAKLREERAAKAAKLRRMRGEAPAIPSELRADEIPAPVPHGTPLADRVRRFKAYLDRLGPCIERQGGHRKGWIACLAAIGFDLEAADAWPAIESWNSGSDDSRKVTRDRLEAAYRDARAPRGWALGGRRSTDRPLEGVQSTSGQTSTLSLKKKNPGSGHLSRIQSPTAKYLPAQTLASLRARRVTFVRAPQGAGKTHALKEVVAETLARGERVVYLCHRQALTRDAAQVLGLPCYLDVEGRIEGSCAICLDSVDRLDLWPDLEDGPQTIDMQPIGLLIIDESEQVIRHLMGGTILAKRRLSAVWSALRATVRASKSVVWQDADLAGLTVRTSRMILGKESEQKIEKTERPHRRVITYVQRLRHREILKGKLEARVAGGERVYYGSTTKGQVRRIAAWVKKDFPSLRYLEISADTTGDPEVAAFLRDPSRAALYDVIIASPTLGTGVSITAAPFEVFYDARTGAGPIDTDVIQALCRVRNPVGDTWRVHVHGGAPWAECDPAAIREALTERTAETLSTLEKIGTTWRPEYDPGQRRVCISADNDELVSLYAEVKAEEAAGAHLGHCLPLLWSRYGYTIDVDEDAPASKKKAKAEERQIADAVEAADVRKVCASPPISDQLAAELETSALVPETEALLRAHRIRQLYNLEPTPELVQTYARGRHARTVRRWVNLKLWQGGEKQAVLSKDARALRHEAGITAPEIKAHAREANLMHKMWAALGITDIEADARAGTPIKLASFDKAAVKTVKKVLGLNLEKLSPPRIAAALAERIGVKLQSERVQVDGVRTRVYRLCRDAVDRMAQLAAHQLEKSRRRIEAAFTPYLDVDLDEILGEDTAA